MIEIVSKVFRAILFVVLAAVGMGMALIFMFSTALAVGVLYVIARVRGRPFGVRAYWQERQAQRPDPAATFAARSGGFKPRRPAEIVDVESRDVP